MEPTQVALTEEQVQALQRLREGLAFHDSFGAIPDDSAVYLDGGSLYELPYGKGKNSRQLSLGDLRDLASIGAQT